MADTNVTANAGAGGAKFSVDDDGVQVWPYSKLAWGPGGTRNEVDDANAKRLPVKVGDPIPAGTNVIGHVIVDSGAVTTTPPADASTNVTKLGGTAIDTNSGNKSAGTLRAVIATDQPNLTTDLNVKDVPQASGGLSFSYVLSAASTNKTSVKGSAGQLYTVVVTNTNAAPRYLKFFNALSANVTMGTTAADFQIVIPGNTAGAGVVVNIDKGIALGTGITIALTAGVALNDNTSVAANEVSALIGYK